MTCIHEVGEWSRMCVFGQSAGRQHDQETVAALRDECLPSSGDSVTKSASYLCLAGAVVVLVGGVATGARGRVIGENAAPGAEGKPADSPEARQVVERAQSWIGGSAKAASVASLAVVGPEDTYEVLFPDMYRRRVKGQTVSAFDGAVLRYTDGNGRPDPAEVENPRVRALLRMVDAMNGPDDVRRNGRRLVAMYALRYLVRTLPTYPMSVTLVAASRCADIRGACVQFLPADASAIYLAVDEKSGQPIAIVTHFGGAGGGLLSIETLNDYRTVDGLRVPFSVVTQRVSPDGTKGEPRTVNYEAIRVNPALTTAEFTLPETK
jgi:hypothetical protein